MQQQRIFFGNENAENDSLLRDCQVPYPGVQSYRQIVTGRWGTGKTAYVLTNHLALNDELKSVNSSHERIWYVSEAALHSDDLINNLSKLEPRLFSNHLERIWRAEIHRRAAIQLSLLRTHAYSNPQGKHWDDVAKSVSDNGHLNTIWSQLPKVLTLLRSWDENQLNSIQGTRDHLNDLFDHKLGRSVQQCLQDVIDNPIQPVVAVEPLDTPHSPLEKEVGLANRVVAALLNVFQAEFQPHDGQLLSVMLSIPWHRISSPLVTLPQKLRQYMLRLQWNREHLRRFINRRIRFEFNELKRPFTIKGDADEWSELFEQRIDNDFFTPVVKEDSFDYVLRHTHYRPRDLQRFVKRAVEIVASKANLPIEDVIRGRGGIKVRGRFIRQAARELSRELSDDLIKEGGRRFPELDELIQKLKFMQSEFTRSQLTKRVGSDKFRPLVDVAWQTGILGVEVRPKDEHLVKRYRDIYPEQTFRRLQNEEGDTHSKFCFFEYNSEYDIGYLMDESNEEDDCVRKLVIHPKLHEHLMVSPASNHDWPHGI